MDFLDREPENERLDQLLRRPQGGLVVVYGRRRVGKTRLLLEWSRRHGGLYTVADQSAPEVQRRYFAQAVSGRLRGFGELVFADWRGLLAQLTRQAAAAKFRGPIVIDELPYLVASSPELPSVLQQWIDHDAREARLVVALAGSSQRMMQGLVLAREAPLYGRAQQVLEITPLTPQWLGPALGTSGAVATLEAWAAWGGVPRYWELAEEETGTIARRIERLVLDPRGPLHSEPDRLLLEETPPATELRPVLDAIGAGAHRISEIGARIGRPATSLSHPLTRLLGLGFVRRDVPMGEPERGGKRALYRLADPFLRLWFRVVAPNRGLLSSGNPRARLELLARHWPGLLGEAFEELAREGIAGLGANSALGRSGPWGPAQRWWWRNHPEWDAVARSRDGKKLLVAEARFGRRALAPLALARIAHEVATRALPGDLAAGSQVVRALCVPEIARAGSLEGVMLVSGAELLLLPG